MTYSSKRQDQLMAKINKVLDRKKLVEPKPKKEKEQKEWVCGKCNSEPCKCESKEESIWDNIRARRAKGLPRLKPGQKGYPKTLKGHEKNEDTAMTTTANIPNPINTVMGPKKKKKLKVFKRWMEDGKV